MELLYITLEEAWAIHDNVRQKDNQGEEWDKDFMVLVMEVILELGNKAPTTLAPLVVNAGDLWQIDRQVDRMLKVGNEFVGMTLLTKVMELLVKGRNDDAREDDYPSKDPNESP